jgi:hypothetical protein
MAGQRIGRRLLKAFILVQVVIEDVLLQEGYIVTRAMDGSAALELLR